MFDSYKTLRIGITRYRDKDRVLEVRLNRPDVGNALNATMLEELLTVLDELRACPDIRVLVLSGAGEHFCLGGDRQEFADFLDIDPSGSRLRASAETARRVCDALATTTTAVTIARLHGKVIGAGVALAAHCDLRVGTRDCTFRLPELGLGLPTAWGGALPRLLAEAGAAAIRELVLTSEEFDAAKAARISLLHRVTPENQLDEVIAAWARPLIRRSADALRVTKTLFNAYANAHKTADLTLFDAELMAATIATSEHYRQAHRSDAERTVLGEPL